MKIQTSELNGEALDWAVAKCLMTRVVISFSGERGCYLTEDFKTGLILDYSNGGLEGWHLFNTRCTAFHRDPDGTCWATVGISQCSGSDILEAFLRALVTERSGKEVDVPDDLVRETV